MSVWIMLLFLFPVSQAPAHIKDDCESLLIARPIRHTPQKKYPIEVPMAGTLIPADATIPILESGFYLYLITQERNVVLAPKYILSGRKRNLVTHKSLLKAYAIKVGSPVPPLIVAAGEFQIGFDEVVEIRNKSGNFRGGPESLTLALQIFKRQGLPISTRTQVRPVVAGAAEDRGHTPKDREVDAFRIEILKSVHRSKRGVRLLELYRRFYFLLRETYPKRVGKDVLEKLIDAQTAGAGFKRDYDGYQSSYYPLQTVFSVDGLEYGIWSVERERDHGGADGFARGVPKQIDNFLFGAQAAINPTLNAKWLQLADEFRKLENVRD